MADIRPFRGIRYNLERVGSLSDVASQPFDMISPEERVRFASRSPHNVVHMILAGELGGSWHQAAAKRFRDWLGEGTLQLDSEPALYAYRHSFDWFGEKQDRFGFIGLLRIEEADREAVYPHERTFPKPKEDRLKLLSAVRAHLEPVFMVHPDPESTVRRTLVESQPSSAVEVTDNAGVCHCLWPLYDKDVIARIREVLSRTHVLLADGHHRTATARTFRDMEWDRLGTRDPEAPCNFFPVYFSALEDSALHVLSPHRVLRGLDKDGLQRLTERLPQHFRVERFNGSPMDFVHSLSEADNHQTGIGLYDGREVLVIAPRGEDTQWTDQNTGRARLAVSVLHEEIIEGILEISPAGLPDHVRFVREVEEAAAEVDGGNADLCFFVRPLSPLAVWDVAAAEDVMPQKSTNFYPKILSGLVFYDFGGEG